MWQRRNSAFFHSYMSSITIVFKTIVMLLFFSSCSGKQKQLGEAIKERDSLPMMKTLGVTTLISDSGVTRYRIKTEEWLIFDKKRPSYWAFEKGVYLEKFDSLLHVDASIKADTAYYYDKQKLWKLMGHVAIKNLQGNKFNTELLYWDQTTEKIYSDKFIRIEQPDKIILGHGFDSNQEMTIYTIHNIEGVFYMDDNKLEAKKDTLKK
nr:LPS export ABC transporter periplasmic protein LptC [uncultured Bacteroides sp.]